MKTFKNVLLALWQLPQILVGYLMLIFYPAEKSLIYKGIKVRINSKFPSWISLGTVIILRKYPTNSVLWADVKHEYGHTRQSVKLGWLYLIVIGIPSLLGNIYDRLFHKSWTPLERYSWYYRQPWERGADKLGGVTRG